MTTRLTAVVVDAADPPRLARFWADALGATVTEEPDGVASVGVAGAPAWGDGGPPRLVFLPVDEPKTGKNRMHLDLASTALAEQRATVERLLDAGARRADIGQEEVPWVVLADPEGNEFCVLEPRETYRGGGPLAAVVVDCADAVELANFWMRASGWPAMRYSEGFAGLRHPRAPTAWLELLETPDRTAAKNRLHLEVAPPAGGDPAAEAERLERAGARRIGIGQGDGSWIVMADPEGNEFCLRGPPERHGPTYTNAAHQ